MPVKPLAVWVALVLCVGLVVVAWQWRGLPTWLMFFGAAGVVVALLALSAGKLPGRRCPTCLAHAGQAFRSEGSRGVAMKPRGSPIPDDKWRKDNPPTGWDKVHYRCGSCRHEWMERTEY
jgi:hypothetical protein